MGLAAARKKTRISHDPNNTNWSRSTSGFGHRILSSQGWTPGGFLGARNAAHADMFTAASASHIRVLVKDDTLGLGARPKRDPLDEPTGLDAFKGLLGRLNGKSDTELQADQKKRDDAKLARYTATKWQTIRFVSGGLLVQEKNDESSTRNIQQDSFDKPPSDKPKKDINKGSPAGDDSRRERKKKKSSDDPQSEVSRSDEQEKKQKQKKQKKRKRTEQPETENSSSKHNESPEQELNSTLVITPREQPVLAVKALAKERRPIGRQMLRGRHIAQKRRALMDEKSLNEIFMVKS